MGEFGDGLEKKCRMDLWTLRPSFTFGDGVDDTVDDDMFVVSQRSVFSKNLTLRLKLWSYKFNYENWKFATFVDNVGMAIFWNRTGFALVWTRFPRCARGAYFLTASARDGCVSSASLRGRARDSSSILKSHVPSTPETCWTELNRSLKWILACTY